MTIDVLIIGQGICGTFLSWECSKKGINTIVIDDAQPASATRVASGVINPVTGRQVVTTWLAEELMPFTWDAYNAIGADINADVISQKDVVVFVPSQQMSDGYDKRIAEANSYIKALPAEQASLLNDFFYSYYGAAVISPVWLVDLQTLLSKWRQKLQQQNLLLEETFDNNSLIIEDSGIRYKNIAAKKIIFCNGIQSFALPYWQNLPFVFNKGEALIVDIPGLPQTDIYKVGNSTIVPWADGLWWVGSSYENEYKDGLPSPLFKQRKLQELQMNLKQPVKIVDHIASLRPAVAVERRPFVGFHPHVPEVGILNGMGTKGCSLAPYFAKQLVENFLSGKPVDPLADVARFKRMLKLA